MPISETTKQKMRMAKLGKPSPLKGKKLSKEHIQKLRISHIGKRNLGYKWSESQKKKFSEYKTGKPRNGNPKNWKHKDSTKLKMKISNLGKGHPGLKGELSPKWIKDRTKLKKSERHHGNSAYQEWRKNVYKRDNFKCKINDLYCNGRIEAHHIFRWSDYPELRYDINNGITLCKFHHPKKLKEEKRLSTFFLKKLIFKK